MNSMPLDDYGVENQAIERRRQMAQALMQNTQQAPQGRMVGRVFVAPNPLEYLAQGVRNFGAGQQLEQADADQKALGERVRTQNSADVQKYIDALRGTSAQPAQTGNNPSAYVPEQAATPGDPNRALAVAMASRNPLLQQLGAAQIKESVPKNVVVGRSLVNNQTGQVVGTDSTWQAEQTAAREAKAAELQARMDDARTSREERAQLQRELAQMRLDGQRELRAMTTAASGAGKPPPGYRFTQDGNLQAIPGGPADQKLAGQLNADTLSLQGATANFDRLAQAANALKNSEGLKGITGLSGKFPNIPGGEAANARAALDTLKSQVAFGVLQDMRNQSKTGGALGAVSEKELALLQNNLQALDQAQSYEQFQKSLQGIMDYAEQAKGRMRDAYNMKHSDKSGGAVPSNSDPLGLRNGR